jgi:hypothetical protein
MGILVTLVADRWANYDCLTLWPIKARRPI